MRGEAVLRAFSQGARNLRRQPRHTVTSVASLALALLVSTVLFALFHGMFLRPVPFRDIESLYLSGPPGERGVRSVTATELSDIARSPGVVESAAFVQSLGSFKAVQAENEGLRDTGITPDFFRVLGITPKLAIDIHPLALDAAGMETVVISDALWRERFGRSSQVVGTPVDMGGKRVLLGGIAPPGFGFPGRTNVWVLHQPRDGTGMVMSYLTAVVRLDVPARTLPVFRASQPFVVRPLADLLTPPGAIPLRTLLLCLLAGVAFAWVQLSITRVAYETGRQADVAIKMAIGATRTAIIGERFAEALLVAVAAAAGALALLPATLSVTLRILPPEIVNQYFIEVDWLTMLVTAALTLTSAAMFAAGSAVATGSGMSTGLLKGRGDGLLAARPSLARVGALLVQTSLMTMFVYVAILGIRSHQRASAIDLGFDPEGLIRVEWADESRAVRNADIRERVEALLRRLPGVEHISYGPLPLRPGRMPVSVTADIPTRIEEVQSLQRNGDMRRVDVGYFETIGTTLTEGRGFERRMDRPGAVILSESLAKGLLPGRSVVGTAVSVNGSTSQVVGIAADVRADGPEHPPNPFVYVYAPGKEDLLARTSGEPETLHAIAASVRQVIGPTSPVIVRQASEEYTRVLHLQRTQALTLASAAGVGMLFGLVSVFTTANEVAHRKVRESALRIALGAQPARVAFQAIRTIFLSVGLGIASGLALGVLAGRWAQALWFGVADADWVGVCSVLLLTGVLAALATLRPARLLASADPSRLLRES